MAKFTLMGIFYKNRQKPRKRRRNFFSREFFKESLKIALIVVSLGLILILAVFVYFAKDLPDPRKIDERSIAESTKIFDRTGQVLLYDIHGEEKRTVIPLAEMPQFIKDATLAAEDANFYHHFGLDFQGILRAAFYNLLGRKISQGGSTITQQFIKKTLLTSERTFTRKIKEAVLALEMERRYSKDQILEFYLNQIPYGSNAYGVEAAAQTFFGKRAKDLTLAESALLASLSKAPSRLSPFGSHPEELKERQQYILDRLVNLNYISKEQAQAAKEEKIKFSASPHGIKAPHFVMYVKEYLEEKYGQDILEKGGLKVITTLDWDLQPMAEQLVLETAQNNWKKYRAYNAALTAIDPKTGQILVMVGSRNYFDIEHDGNVNVTIRDRQPGSSFKPFAYVTALKKGYTPQTVIFDLKTEFNPNCPADGSGTKDQFGLNCYHPENYDDKLRGPVTMKEALAQSLNIPSVKVLYLAGIKDTIKTAKTMGITTLNDPNRYGLALVLGGGEVKLLDQVAAYSVFAHEGIKQEKTAILKIENQKGKILEEFKPKPEKVLEPRLARQISDILSDNQARAPVFGPNSPLFLPERPVAAKTGTTQEYRDAWALGYTPSLAFGVWVGNNDNSAMVRAGAGVAAAGPLWQNFIRKVYEIKSKTDQEEKPNEFKLPKEIEQFNKSEPVNADKPILNGQFVNEKIIKINKITEQTANDLTPPELIQEITCREVHTILYYLKKDEPLGGPPSNPADDPQLNNWEASVLIWAAQRGYNNQILPKEIDNSHSAEKLPKIKIVYPSANQIISQSKITAQIQTSAPLGVKQVDYFIDDEFLRSTLNPPYDLTAAIPLKIPNGSHILKARLYDQAYNRQEDEVVFILSR